MAKDFYDVEPGYTVVLNANLPQINVLLEAATAAGIGNVVTYGFARGVDWQIAEAEIAADHSFADIVHDGERYSLALGVAGRHMVSNATAALAVAHLAGIAPDVALRALAGFGAQPGRGQRLSFGPSDRALLLIDESYNANTASMGAALDVFAAIAPAGGRKVVVLGDMLELGEAAEDLHAGLADAVRNSGAERVHLIGPHMAALAAALPPHLLASHFPTVEEAVDVIMGDLAYGDALMVKGSNGVGLSRIVTEIKSRFAQS